MPYEGQINDFFHTCAPISELQSNISTMWTVDRPDTGIHYIIGIRGIGKLLDMRVEVRGVGIDSRDLS